METAIYKYRVARGAYPFKEFETLEMRVHILDDTGKRLRVKFLEYHADGRGPGFETAVARKNVIRAGGTVGGAPRTGKTDALRQYLDKLDSDEIRKPYKD